MNWIMSLAKSLFGSLLSFFKDSYDEEKLRKEASEAEAAKKRLQSSLEAEQAEKDMAAIVADHKTKPRITRESLNEAIRQRNQG